MTTECKKYLIALKNEKLSKETQWREFETLEEMLDVIYPLVKLGSLIELYIHNGKNEWQSIVTSSSQAMFVETKNFFVDLVFPWDAEDFKNLMQVAEKHI